MNFSWKNLVGMNLEGMNLEGGYALHHRKEVAERSREVAKHPLTRRRVKPFLDRG
jgi:hypothetical protein